MAQHALGFSTLGAAIEWIWFGASLVMWAFIGNWCIAPNPHVASWTGSCLRVELLDESLAVVGLQRDEVYLTNAVKHFKWEQRGKRRLHKKPRRIEVTSCRAWLEAEIAVVQPQLIVCLGATAAQSLLGAAFRVTQQRGKILSISSGAIMATYHPSAILRAPDQVARDRMRQDFMEDLQRAAVHVGGID